MTRLVFLAFAVTGFIFISKSHDWLDLGQLTEIVVIRPEIHPGCLVFIFMILLSYLSENNEMLKKMCRLQLSPQACNSSADQVG